MSIYIYVCESIPSRSSIETPLTISTSAKEKKKKILDRSASVLCIYVGNYIYPTELHIYKSIYISHFSTPL